MTAATIGLVLAAIPVLIGSYAYVVYPAILHVASARRRRREGDSADEPGSADRSEPAEWPILSVSLPAFNEELTIAGAIDAILAADYPSDRLQVLVISDASSDRTDEIVAAYRDPRVELVRQHVRAGKTAAENAAAPRVRGTIVVNTDASIRILPGSLKPMVRALSDPRVGVASGRDISVGADTSDANLGESGYVGYEMWVRSLESRVGSIVGASGCFYATRRELHQIPVREDLSRDFAAVLKARTHGYRSVHVQDAVCLVPRAGSVRAERRRKARTMARGLATLWHYRHLLDPRRYGGFAVALASHKLARWVLPLSLPVGLVGLALLAPTSALGAIAFLTAIGAVCLGTLSLIWAPEWRGLPPLVNLFGYALGSGLAGIEAWPRAWSRASGGAIWEPTRRRVPGAVDDRR